MFEGAAEPDSSVQSLESFLDPTASMMGQQLLELLEAGRTK